MLRYLCSWCERPLCWVWLRQGDQNYEWDLYGLPACGRCCSFASRKKLKLRTWQRVSSASIQSDWLRNQRCKERFAEPFALRWGRCTKDLDDDHHDTQAIDPGLWFLWLRKLRPTTLWYLASKLTRYFRLEPEKRCNTLIANWPKQSLWWQILFVHRRVEPEAATG